MNERRLVVVTRPAEEAERTRAALINYGYDVLIEPLLSIAPMQDAAERLGNLDGVAALLFTSVNGVRAFAGASARRDLPVYAVGPTTAEAAAGAGFRTVKIGAGDAQALARLVVSERRPDDGKLLHPAGETVAGDLAGELGRRGFDVRRVALYRAEPARSLSSGLRDTLAEDRAGAIAFFSPRTARTFVTLARTAGLEGHCQRLVAACLSPAVAEAAGSVAWRQIAVAEQPTQAALIEILGRSLAPAGGVAGEHGGMAEDKKDEATPGTPDARDPSAAEPGGGEPVPPPRPADAASPAPTITLSAAEVIQRFGGIRPMASKMNISFSTVQGWKERNHLPPARHAEIAALAAKHGVTLEPNTAPVAPVGAAPVEALAAQPPAPDGSQVEPHPTAAPKHAAEPPGFEDKPPPLPPPLPPQSVPPSPQGIGVFGAAVVSIVVVAVALFGAYATRSMWSGANWSGANWTGAGGAPAGDSAELAQRLARLEREATARSAAIDPKLAQDIAAVTKKTAEIDTALAKRGAEIDAALAKKGAEIDAALAKKGAELDAALAQARSSSAAAAEQAKALAPRLEALEKGFDLQAFLAVRSGLAELGGKLDGLAKRMEATERAAAAARALGLAEAALAISVAQLRHTIDAGSPFVAELAACRAASGNDAKVAATLDALAPYAGTGVATRAVLDDDFADAARAIAQASLKRSQSGWLRSVIDRIDSLVTIRPVGPDVAGDDPRARVARAETLLDRGDLAGAARVLGGLVDRPAEAAKPWLDRAMARLAAEGAVAALENQAMAGLAQRAAQAQPANAPKPAGATQ